MKITVVLCTYNRCQSLAKALNGIATQILPESTDWEVLVVDNNSTDGTRAVADDFCHRYPGRFRYVFEPNQGQSHARNAGVREAEGDVIAFTDDDITVEPMWLQNLTAPMKDGQWAGTGGRTLLERDFSPPPWLGLREPYDLGGPLAQFDSGERPFELDRPPVGANMAFRKEIFRKYGGFRTDLGTRPGSEIRNEDSEFGRRLLAAGERLWYEPSAVVYHPVPDHRARKEYFLKWWFDHGRGLVREWGRGPALLGIPRPYFNILRLLSTAMVQRIWRWVSARDPQRRFFWKCWVWATAGQIKEYYRLARSTQAEG